MPTLERPSAERGTTESPPSRAGDVPSSAPGKSPELRDAQFMRALTYGAVLGAPLLFVVLMPVAWLANSFSAGVVVAMLWPTLVSGPFFGGVIVLGVMETRAARRGQHHDHG